MTLLGKKFVLFSYSSSQGHARRDVIFVQSNMLSLGNVSRGDLNVDSISYRSILVYACCTPRVHLNKMLVKAFDWWYFDASVTSNLRTEMF